MAQIELHTITKELLTAIDGAFAVSPFADTIRVDASGSLTENGTDTITNENECMRLTVLVNRQKKLIYIFGFMKQILTLVPGTPCFQRFKGEIVLDFSKPEMKADGNMYVDVFARMMKQYNAIASLMKEEIVY